MGTVYLAECDGEQFALKVLHPHLLTAKGFFRRFEREARAGAAVHHPNVVRVVDFDLLMTTGRPRCFPVMEYFEGRTLRELCSQDGPRPDACVQDIGRQVAAGLSAIHSAGIVHRDIKPENVLITDEQRVLVMDLGVARLVDASTSLTAEGQLAGSMLYASPEQMLGYCPGPASDLSRSASCCTRLQAGATRFAGTVRPRSWKRTSAPRPLLSATSRRVAHRSSPPWSLRCSRRTLGSASRPPPRSATC